MAFETSTKRMNKLACFAFYADHELHQLRGNKAIEEEVWSSTMREEILAIEYNSIWNLTVRDKALRL